MVTMLATGCGATRQKDSGELICARALDGGWGEINPAPTGHEKVVCQARLSAVFPSPAGAARKR